jgi:predicted O-methyltransferase YrrM
MQKSRALARGMKSIREDARGWSQGLDVISAQGDWMQPVHQRLGWNWPCDESSAFQKCWADIEQMLVAADPTEPYYDADPVMARSLWCAVRHLQPKSVVETGVARGVTSRVILEALTGNGAGRLWSIDLPPLNEPWFSQSRSAVPQALRQDWHYVCGSARRVLPRLLGKLGTIDLFVHDSLHTYDHMAFEFTLARAHLSPIGMIVSDDINTNRAFVEMVQSDQKLDGVVVTQQRKRDAAMGIAWQLNPS